ncbi:hypothetical protein H8356DRAFT_1328710 [Neocallimastix lanati (nom. inval.)]|nr:hypothetical protein H8356DRAFT_1328710 [Neocallimastix sp. JGI-2020a]
MADHVTKSSVSKIRTLVQWLVTLTMTNTSWCKPIEFSPFCVSISHPAFTIEAPPIIVMLCTYSPINQNYSFSRITWFRGEFDKFLNISNKANNHFTENHLAYNNIKLLSNCPNIKNEVGTKHYMDLTSDILLKYCSIERKTIKTPVSLINEDLSIISMNNFSILEQFGFHSHLENVLVSVSISIFNAIKKNKIPFKIYKCTTTMVIKPHKLCPISFL